MNKRTIFFITITLLIVLAFVQVTLVSAEGEDPPPCVGEECAYVPPETEPCENPEGCPAEPDPDPDPDPPPYCPEGCEEEEVPPVEEPDCAGNPGNAKCVGKAGEKEDMGGFYPPSEGGTGTHGRSDPGKHKEHPAH